jgi:hypothetical protein
LVILVDELGHEKQLLNQTSRAFFERTIELTHEVTTVAEQNRTERTIRSRPTGLIIIKPRTPLIDSFMHAAPSTAHLSAAVASASSRRSSNGDIHVSGATATAAAATLIRPTRSPRLFFPGSASVSRERELELPLIVSPVKIPRFGE